MKPILIGETPEGDFEFGELYHLATALILKPELKCAFSGCPEEHKHYKHYINFLEKFSQNKINIVCPPPSKVSKSKYLTMDYTAEIFKRYSGQPNNVHKRFNEFIYPNRFKDFGDSLGLKKSEKHCLLWIRNSTDPPYKEERNITSIAINQISNLVLDANIKPILIGPQIGKYTHRTDNLIEFYKYEPYKDPLNQLSLIKYLREQYDLRFSIGMMSGSMDGPAFAFGLRTVYLARDNDNNRMKKVCKTFSQFTHIPIKFNKYFVCLSQDELEKIKKIIMDIIHSS